VGLEDSGGDGAEAVEEDLQGKDAEEEHREVGRLPRRIRGELPRGRPVRREGHQRFGEHHAEQRNRHEQRQHQGEQGVGEASGVLLSLLRHAVHQQRDEDGVEDPAHEKLVDKTRQEVGDRVGVGDHPHPENRGLHHRPHIARRPREDGGRGDREHGPQDGRHVENVTTTFLVAIAPRALARGATSAGRRSRRPLLSPPRPGGPRVSPARRKAPITSLVRVSQATLLFRRRSRPLAR
jgi:hypothetical protein